MWIILHNECGPGISPCCSITADVVYPVTNGQALVGLAFYHRSYDFDCTPHTVRSMYLLLTLILLVGRLPFNQKHTFERIVHRE